MNDKRVEAAARLIGCVLNYECGGDWDKLNDFAKEHYTRVAKSALELADAAAWRPMETAPHGVLLYGYEKDWSTDFGVTNCYLFQLPDEEGEYAMTADGLPCWPTHWQPLPAPPSDATP